MGNMNMEDGAQGEMFFEKRNTEKDNLLRQINALYARITGKGRLYSVDSVLLRYCQYMLNHEQELNLEGQNVDGNSSNEILVFVMNSLAKQAADQEAEQKKLAEMQKAQLAELMRMNDRNARMLQELKERTEIGFKQMNELSERMFDRMYERMNGMDAGFETMSKEMRNNRDDGDRRFDELEEMLGQAGDDQSQKEQLAGLMRNMKELKEMTQKIRESSLASVQQNLQGAMRQIMQSCNTAGAEFREGTPEAQLAEMYDLCREMQEQFYAGTLLYIEERAQKEAVQKREKFLEEQIRELKAQNERLRAAAKINEGEVWK